MSKLMRRNGNGSILINRMHEEVDDMLQRLMGPMRRRVRWDEARVGKGDPKNETPASGGQTCQISI